MRYILLRRTHLASLLLILFAGVSGAQVLNTGGATSPTNSISYQAQITGKDGKPISGEHTVTITLYTDATGTQSIWTSTTKSSIGVGGILNASLGTPENPLPTPSRMDRPLWVGVSVDGTPELRPLATLSAAPVALNVADNAITANKLAPNAVTADKIGADYVGSISVNGEKVTPKGGDLNIVTGDGLRSTYVSTLNTLVLSGVGSVADGKVQYVATNPCGTNNDGGTANNTVSGGCANTIVNPITFSVIGGGQGNTATNQTAVGINPPGEFNSHHVIGGGLNNTIISEVNAGFQGENGTLGAGTISGGQSNTICGPAWGVISGGQNNIISTEIPTNDDDGGDLVQHDAIVGGLSNSIDSSASKSFIGGGQSNHIAGSGTFNGTHNFIVGKTADHSAIAGGQNNTIWASNWGTIGGGASNLIDSVDYCFVGGGINNKILTGAGSSVIGGGWLNTATGHLSAILGGDSNIAAGATSAVGGGELNKAYGDNSVIAGGRWNVTGTPAGQGEGTFVGGGWQDTAIDRWSGTVAGTQLQTTGEAQVVMGWKNIRAGGSHVLTGGPNDDRIFEIGSPRFNGPDWNPLNAFEVSYNGHSIVYDVNGSIASGPRPVIQGATYVESPVYAWGEIDATGAPVGNANFGIASVSLLPPNIYMITMNPQAPYGGPLPDIREASITVTVVNNDTSDIFLAWAPESSVASSSGRTFESVPDSVVRAEFGDSPIASGSHQTALATVQSMPLAASGSCGYATASQIGVKAAFPRTFFIRTYGGGTSGCDPVPLPFFFKVCHR